MLRIAVILHGCGKFISLSNAGESAYHIIMAMDIIGLSEEEKEIVANVVKYNTVPLEGYDKIGSSRMTRENYRTIAKLTAIPRSGKFAGPQPQAEDQRGKTDIARKRTGHSALFWTKICHWKRKSLQKSRIFEEVFSIRPVPSQKKMM